MKKSDGSKDVDRVKARNSLLGRRTALKKIVTGGGVVAGTSLIPGKWIAPVVDKVVVPAHAQTSVTTTAPPTTTTTTTLCPAEISCEIDPVGEPNDYETIVRVTATSACGQDLTGAVILVTVIDERDPRETCDVGPHEVVLDVNGKGGQLFPHECFNFTARVTAAVEFKDTATYGTDTGECSYTHIS